MEFVAVFLPNPILNRPFPLRRCHPHAPAWSKYWVTELYGKAPYREMRGFVGREKQQQSGALGTANQQPAS